MCAETVDFVVSDEVEAARRLHEEVCRFASTVKKRGVGLRARLLVALERAPRGDPGSELRRSRPRSPNLESVLVRDFKRFLASTGISTLATRRRTGVAPSSSGRRQSRRTRIRALLREIDLHVLYVKASRRSTNPRATRSAEVFDEARDRAPCVLVLETSTPSSATRPAASS